METMYVVVTIYDSPTTGNQIVHAYGPFHYDKASYERKRIIGQYPDEITAGDLTVKNIKVLDPENKSSFIWGRKP